ncbi:MAG: type II secretion system protein [Candidatus Methylomirabilales bacterium]
MKRAEGFSLIEVILVILLVGILAAVLIPPFRQSVQSYSAVETRGDLNSQAREAVTRMIRELRNIQKEADNTPNITAADAASITFVDVLDNTITFSLAGSAVQRGSDSLVDNVSSLQFRYFDGSNAELTTLPLSAADRDNVRRIMLVLTLAEGDQTILMTEQAFLRELTGY